MDYNLYCVKYMNKLIYQDSIDIKNAFILFKILLILQIIHDDIIKFTLFV